MKKVILFLAIASLLEHSGCGKDLFCELENASESVEIANRMYSVETRVSRDFFPGLTPPEGSSLIATAIITASDSTIKFPDTIDADVLWVFNGKEIWTGKISWRERYELPGYWNRFAVLARGGPRWGPGINVDVLVRIIDKKKHRDYFLKALDQTIRSSG